MRELDIAKTIIGYLKANIISIIFVIAASYHQQTVFDAQLQEYKAVIRDKDEQVLKLLQEEKRRLVERESELIRQRDEYFRMYREEASKRVPVPPPQIIYRRSKTDE